MRIAHQFESKHKTPRGVLLLLVLLLISSLGSLRAEEPSGPAEVRSASVEVTDGAVIVDLAMSRTVGIRSFTLTSPYRLVFDIEDSLLVLDEEAVTVWKAPITGVTSLEITQFSTEPPVVRIVAEVNDPTLGCARANTADGLKLAVFRGENPLVDFGPGLPPDHAIPTIEDLWHERAEGGRDRFLIVFSYGVVLPQIRIESPTVILLRFPGTDILLPASDPTNFATGVDGHIVERMRAERLALSGSVDTEVRLTIDDTSILGYTLRTDSEDTLELILFHERSLEPQPAEELSDTTPPVPTEGSQIMVLASSDDIPTPADAPIRIHRVQFQTIDGGIDRFYIYYEGGVLEARTPQRLNYPTRIAFSFPDAAVVLPEDAGDRFQTPVAGLVASELKVFNRVIEDVGPECQFVFYFPETARENIDFTLDYVDEGELHVDFFATSVPIDIESPIEVNLSIPELEDGSHPELVEAPEIIEVEVEVEDIEVPAEDIEVEPIEEPAPEAIEEPVPGPVEEPKPAEEPAPEVAEGATVCLVGGEIIGGNVVFHITTSEQLPMPEVVEYHYPDRVGLRFPLADVELLDAGQGVYTTNTQIRAVPSVRAIIKDREDEQHTTLLFTLDGSLEEFDTELDWNGTEMTLAFQHVPLPAEPIKPSLELVEEPGPELAEEPEPVLEPAEEAVEETIPEPVEETEPEIAEDAGTPMAPGAPPFDSPGSLPTIRVLLEKADGDEISFRIVASEPMPEPGVIHFKYPDRLGLRFPLSEIELLDEEAGVYTAHTHVSRIPLVRAIVKDTEDAQYTTVTFTLEGAFEEFEKELVPDGENELLVAFRYIPLPEVIEEPLPTEPAVEPTVTVEPVPETTVAMEPAPVTEVEVEVLAEPVTEEKPEAEVEEPTVETEPEIEETEETAEAEVKVEAIAEPEVIEEKIVEAEEPEVEAKPEIEEEIVEEQGTAVVEESEIEEPVLIADAPSAEEDESFEFAIESDETEALEPVPVEEPETEAVYEEISGPEIISEPVIAQTEEEPEVPEFEAIATVEIRVDEPDQWEEPFDGVLITGISFERMGDADVLRLNATGLVEDWEVMPVNFPPKIQVKLRNSRPSLPGTHPQRYEQVVDGAWMDHLTVTSTASLDTSFTILSIYTHTIESTEFIEFDVQARGDEWIIAVYGAGGESPFESWAAPEVAGPAAEDFVLPEYEIMPVVPQPVPVVGPDEAETQEIISELEAPSRRLSMRLDNANIRDVLQLIGERAGLDIMINPEVQGSLTISLTDIELFDLLDLLGANMGFTYVVRHGVYIFGDSQDLQARFRDVWPTWYIRLSYAVADQVRRILTGMGILSGDQIQIYSAGGGGGIYGGVKVAEERVILSGDERDLERAYRVIAAIDQAPVMIQVDFQIISTSLTDNQNFGFDFDISTGGNTGMTALTFFEKVGLNPNAGPLPQGFYRPVSMGSPNQWNINYTINYLLEEGYAELMNRSTLTVANNQTGSLRVGETIPYRSTYQVSDLGRVTQRIDQQQLGLTLRFTAHANPDDSVTIVLTPENRNLLELTDIGPRTVDQSFNTTVRVQDGEPFIIGGFIRDEERVNYDRFPFLSDLPLIGHLFRSREIQKVKSELIFVFTPHLIKPVMHLPEVLTDEDFDVPLPVGRERY